MATLTITPDSAFSILVKAREFDSKVTETDPDSGSNPSDDDSVDALEFGPPTTPTVNSSQRSMTSMTTNSATSSR
jgi:hypothetical protein